MRFIHSKDIYYITRDVLKCLDQKVVNHGARTSYILYKMLQCAEKYEMYEIAEFAMIATLHDIGAFKTDLYTEQLHYETKEYMPHSVYGYLFFLYLTPFADRAKIILYHHTDYERVPKTNYEFNDIIHCLNVAEKMDIYSNILGSKFDYMMFNKQAGTKFSPKALELLYQAVRKYDIFKKLSTGEYKQELSELYEYLIFTNQEKHDWILGLMYCVGFRSEYTMLDMVTCVCLCEQIAEKLLLSQNEKDLLYYAAVLHDAGMCDVPKDIIEAPRKLTAEEMQELRNHVNTIEEILKGRVDQDVLDIIVAHHERGDGSGYPKRLREQQMNRLQMILQVADMVTALISKRSYREPKTKDEVIAILREDADAGKLSKEIVRTVITYYDKIMEGVNTKKDETLAMYRKLVLNYDITYKQTKS